MNHLGFYGVIIKETLAYPLENKVPVYLTGNVQDLVHLQKDDDTVACLYYVPEYKEYCIEPYVKRTIYLESGQPLGNRRYYLYRGAKIYIYNKNCMIKLG